MFLLKTLLPVLLVSIGVAHAQTTSCYAGNTYTTFTEVVVSVANKGCYNYFVGPVFKTDNITMALSNGQVTCDSNQKLMVFTSDWKPYYDYCGAVRQGKTVHLMSYTGGYLIIQIVNNLSQALSFYLHYGLFNHLPGLATIPPATAPPTVASTAAPTAAPTAASTAAPVSASCGVPAFTPITTGMKIVGGFSAIAFSLPWQVMVITRANNYIYLCGGSLISDQWIVTAAHCVVGSGTTTIYMGIYNYNDIYTAGKYTSRVVSKIVVNPGWNSNTMKNDIALMKLTTPVTFNSQIQPICLPTSNLATSGRYAMVSGWGDTSNGGSTSNPLMEAIVPIRDILSCGFSNADSTTQICAGDPNLNSPIDTCQGDSGGPLVLKDANNRYNLVGVTSYGGPCNGEGIYTNVFAFVSWIKQTMASG